MHVIWHTTLRVRDVAFPVRLATMIRKRDPEFRTLHATCGTPTGQARVCRQCDTTDLPDHELVRGFEITRGTYIPIHDDELAQLCPSTPEITTLCAVKPDHVDPALRQKAWWLAPDDTPIGRHPYTVITSALHQTGLALVATFQHWGRDHLALVRPVTPALLAAETLLRHGDLVTADEILDELPHAPEHPDELDLATRLLKQLHVRRWQHADHPSHWRTQVTQLIDAKTNRREYLPQHHQRPQPGQQAALPIDDLTTALKRSLRRQRQRG